jgi:small subunit ribosomal protein S24e
MKLINEKNTPLLKRKQVVYEVEHFKKPTPKKIDILKSLATTTKTSEEAISLVNILTPFGGEKSKITANIYNSKEDKESIEKINKNSLKQKKKSTGEATPETPTAKEAPKVEEKPKETPKEEKKE